MSDRLPQPREGFLGLWDRIVGPGATRAETSAMLVAMVVSVGLAAWAALTFGPVHWQWWTWIVILLLASDLGGGARRECPAGDTALVSPTRVSSRDHLASAAMHVHAFVFAWLAPAAMPWPAAIALYCWMLVSCIVILLFPLILRRAVAFALTALGELLFGTWVPIASPARLGRARPAAQDCGRSHDRA